MMNRWIVPLIGIAMPLAIVTGGILVLVVVGAGSSAASL